MVGYADVTRFLLLLIAAGCSLTRPEIDELFPDEPALKFARSHPDDADAQVAAAEVLFGAAELEYQQGLAAALNAEPPRSVEVLLRTQDRLSQGVHGRVLAMCEEGARFARRGIELDPDRADARLQLAKHLSRAAWAKGATRALFAGDGPRLRDAIQAAVEADAELDHAAPLRLQGRFLSRAPWPYRDRPRARRILERALHLAPLAVHHLFLAEVLYREGEQHAALVHWQQVLVAKADDSTRAALPYHREFARWAIMLTVEESED